MAKTMTLEAAIVRLEEIAAKMGEEISLDDAMKLYEESVKLIDFANKKLETARLRIEKLNGENRDESV